MVFNFNLADNDVWLKKRTRPDGSEYYTYILIYKDDILIVSHDPDIYVKQLQAAYYVKEDSIGPPRQYLGQQIKKVKDHSSRPAWASSCNTYVAEAICIIEARMKVLNLAFTKASRKATSPFSSSKYNPELDISDFCSPTEHQFFQQMIGILRWIIEIGFIAISIEVSYLSRYLAQPRVGHMVQAMHIFSFLKNSQSMDLCYDPTKLNVKESTIIPDETAAGRAATMKSMYPDAEDLLPSNAPPPLGRSVQINSFVDADLAGELTTRRSQTGILIFLCMAPILWYSKRQNTVECSTFGSEFVAMRILIEILEGLRYKLRMFGVPLDGPCNVFCDNQAVITSTMNAECTLKKKNLSIAYHKAREAVAANVILVFYERSGSNLADLLTKILPPPLRRKIMSYICGKVAPA